jgi:hypothetical protein
MEFGKSNLSSGRMSTAVVAPASRFHATENRLGTPNNAEHLQIFSILKLRGLCNK